MNNPPDYKMYDSFLESVLVVDQTGRFIYANPTAMEILGLRVQTLQQTIFPGSIQFSPTLKWNEEFFKSLSTATPYVEVQFANGKKMGTVQVSIQPLLSGTDEKHFLISMYDRSAEYNLHQKYRVQITQKEELAQEINNHRAELLLTNSKLDRKLEHISFLLEFSESTRFLLDEETIIQDFLNRAIEKIGFSVGFYFKWNTAQDAFSIEASTTSSVANRIELPKSFNSSELLSLAQAGLAVFSSDKNEVLKTFYKAFYPQQIYNMASLCLKSGNQVMGFVHLVNFMQNPKIDIDTIEFLEFLMDPLAITLKTAKLYQTSITDELTQLNNVRYFHSRLSTYFSQAGRESKTFAVLLCDVDHFKKVNDTYGHPVGDQVLQTVAKNLKAQLRTSDLIARYGGEEMAVVLFDTDEKGAQVAAEKLRVAVQNGSVSHSSGPLKVTISIGLAVYPRHAMTKEKIIEAADQALYKAKAAGRNNCQTFKVESSEGQ